MFRSVNLIDSNFRDLTIVDAKDANSFVVHAVTATFLHSPFPQQAEPARSLLHLAVGRVYYR